MRIETAGADEPVSGTLVARDEAALRRPLLVAIHGGGCSGRYFEIGRGSLAETAPARGWPLLLLNRPGHAGNAILVGDAPIAASIPPIRRFVQQVRREHLPLSSSILLIGHSVGGAVATMLAVWDDGWPVRGLAISGIGDVPTEAVCAWFVVGAGEPDPGLFFGPPGSFDWRNATALRRSNEPWQMAEVREIIGDWPQLFGKCAAAVNVPIHLRLAEGEKIWENRPEALRRMASTFTNAPRVDAAILPEGGHLYEIHRRGPELIEAQLDFLEGCASGD